MRIFVNKPGVVYDPLKTTVIFAEDMQEIKTRLDGGRVFSGSGAGPIAVSADDYDVVQFAPDQTTLTLSNFTGTPVNGQKMLVELFANGNDVALTFGTDYVSGGVDLPTDFLDGERLTLGFIYSTLGGLNKWRLVASSLV